MAIMQSQLVMQHKKHKKQGMDLDSKGTLLSLC